MKEYIEHSGVIESIEGSHIRVHIVQVAACSGCKAKSLCTSSESKDKIVDVYDSFPDRWSVGDAVVVRGSLSMGKVAVRLAFGVPILIIVSALLFAKITLGLSDGYAILLTCVPLFLYFFVIYMLKDKMSKRFVMWIEKDE